MANVRAKEVSDGSHNVIYKEAGAGEIPSLTAVTVSGGENVRYKLAGAGEVPTAIVSFEAATAFTIDSTSYTIDSTAVTVDKTEI